MTRLEPRIAGPEHDDSIRALLREQAVPGHVTLSFECEPSYVASRTALGPFSQTIVGVEPGTSNVRAMACRSIREQYIGGRAEDIGYLSHLRIGREQQGRWILSRGMRVLAGLHDDGRTRGYVTTIIAGSEAAHRALIDLPRPGFPRFSRIGVLHTLAMYTHNRRIPDPAAERCPVDKLPEALAALASARSRTEFGNVWRASDLDGTSGPNAQDVFVLRRGATIAAVAALWDQSASRQTVVRGYSRPAALGLPIMRLALGTPALPPIGQPLRVVYAALVATVDDGDREAVTCLLSTLLAEAAARGHSFLVTGFVEGDPLLTAARRFRHLDYASDIFAVGWDESFASSLGSSLPHLEVACL